MLNRAILSECGVNREPHMHAQFGDAVSGLCKVLFFLSPFLFLSYCLSDDKPTPLALLSWLLSLGLDLVYSHSQILL